MTESPRARLGPMPVLRNLEPLLYFLWVAVAGCGAGRGSAAQLGAGAGGATGSGAAGAAGAAGGAIVGRNSGTDASPRDASAADGPSVATTEAGLSRDASVANGGFRDAAIADTADSGDTGDAGVAGAKDSGLAGTEAGTPSGGADAAACQNANVDKAGAVNINQATELQNISGFGGANIIGSGWIADLTSDQVTTAFGTGNGQIGLSILRIRIPFDASDFAIEVPTAKQAISLGAKVIATPWTPPANQKTNDNIVGGQLNPASYGAFAAHLMSFRDFMQTNGAPLYAVSVQNEPDITVTYESCSWNATQLLGFIKAQGARWGTTKLIAAESFHFDHSITDALLNDTAAAGLVNIIGGHIYGAGLADYPLARTRGKEVWMTEHFTESASSGNAWPLALDVGTEIHNSMVANFSAYVWWYIRRSYGPILEDGTVSKRGYLIAQYARFVRPGSVRVAASTPSTPNVNVTAYKKDGQVIVVAVNTSASAQTVTLNLRNGCVGSFARYTTSGTKNLVKDPSVTLTANSASVALDARSVTTFVSE